MKKTFWTMRVHLVAALTALLASGCSSIFSSKEEVATPEVEQPSVEQTASEQVASESAPETSPVPQPPAEPVDPQTLPQAEKIKLAEAILDNLLESMRDGNYKGYVKDFTQGLKDNVTEKDFRYRNEKMNDEIGSFKSKETLGVLNKKLFDVFLWKAKFSKHDDEQLIRLILISDDKKYKVYMFNISPF